jgi:isoquinoline 1-oxidoreductase alpha subunit
VGAAGHLGITSVKYTCGIAECGMCTVLIDGEAQRSCVVNVEEVAGKRDHHHRRAARQSSGKVAWIEKQVPQCGYCQPGIMLQAVDFLSRMPNPTEEQINDEMDNVICRCGSHPRIKQAIRMAAEMTQNREGKP